jgi:hypothetical protein
MNNLKLTGILGLIGAVMVGIAEFLLHYNTNGYNGANYSFFVSIADNRLIIGHFIVVFFVPFYIAGYWHFYLAVRNGSQPLALAVLIAGVFAFVIGGMWIGSRGMLGFIAKSYAAGETSLSLLDKYRLLMETLVQILRVIVIVISILMVTAILKGKTLYPKWMVFFNPALVLAVVFIVFFLTPSVGKFIAPTAMNVTHITVFTASLIALKNKHPII